MNKIITDIQSVVTFKLLVLTWHYYITIKIPNPVTDNSDHNIQENKDQRNWHNL